MTFDFRRKTQGSVKPDQEESSFWWWPCGWCRHICPTFKLPYVRQSPILHWVFLQNIHQLPEWFHHDTGIYKITILGIFIPIKNFTNFRENYQILSFRIFFGNNRDPCQLVVTTSSQGTPLFSKFDFFIKPDLRDLSFL